MHYGNIGAFLGGISALIIAVAALIRSPAALRAWIGAQNAKRELAEDELAAAQRERRRNLDGWSMGTVNSFRVVPATDQADVAEACDALLSGSRSPCVVLRIAESDDDDRNAGRAAELVRLVEREGFIARRPDAGEREALEAGLVTLGIPRAQYA
jgi:hypothetical protein